MACRPHVINTHKHIDAQVSIVTHAITDPHKAGGRSSRGAASGPTSWSKQEKYELPVWSVAEHDRMNLPDVTTQTHPSDAPPPSRPRLLQGGRRTYL
jgi:hypothetical protein